MAAALTEFAQSIGIRIQIDARMQVGHILQIKECALVRADAAGPCYLTLESNAGVIAPYSDMLYHKAALIYE